MPEGITCSLCNKPLKIGGERIEPYYSVRAEAVDFKDKVRGKSSFTLKICNDCLEEKLLTPADDVEKDFKKRMYEECDCE